MSWNFPAKIKNSLRPIPSFEMMSKFPGWDHSCRRRYVNKLFGGKKKKERERQHTLAYVEPLLNGHATVVGGHATVTRPSDNVSWMFQAIWKFFDKSH